MSVVFAVTASLMAITLTGCAIAGAGSRSLQEPGSFGELCVSRPEDNGVLNIRQAQIVVDNRPVLDLLGGQAGCARVPPGAHVVRAQSRHPYEPDLQDPKGWTSPPLAVEVSSGGTVDLLLWAGGARSVYTGWVIQTSRQPCE
jgi:hypothetical protein